MNTKIVRNFAMMALMLGAAFVLGGNKAQAQNNQESCYDNCGYQLNECVQSVCASDYGVNCIGPNGAQQGCYDQFDQCMASCGISISL